MYDNIFNHIQRINHQLIIYIVHVCKISYTLIYDMILKHLLLNLYGTIT